MTDKKTYQVRRYRNGVGNGFQVATGLETLAEAVEVAWRMARWQEEEGGISEYTILPD